MYFLHGSASVLTLPCFPVPALPNRPDINPTCSELSLLYHSSLSLPSPPPCAATFLSGAGLGLGLGLTLGL